MSGKRLELVGRRGEGQAGEKGDAARHLLVEALGCIEAGADGGAALGQFHQSGHRAFDTGNAVLDLLGIAGEFLAKGERRRILRMGAADLDDLRPQPGLLRQRLMQMMQSGEEIVMDLLGAGDMHGGGIGVVRRLAHIDMVVRMHR